MGIRAERNRTNPDLGVLSGRLLFAVQSELFASRAAMGFADIQHRHGAVLAYLDLEGVRTTELSRLSGQHKQVVGRETFATLERERDQMDARISCLGRNRDAISAYLDAVRRDAVPPARPDHPRSRR
ncbi:MAG TPA: MarR family transcriptional regulator [Pseudonocardia sp.]|nr:MarR family transcriptional regulator [Pseudonocardia sp.]